MSETKKTLIIMRGLPWTGKSFRAKQIVSEAAGRGEPGVIYSTDEYFYTQVNPEKPDEYSFNQRLLGVAHKWNLLRAQSSIEQSHPLIIIDNTNTTFSEPKPYVEYAVPQGYEVKFEEPTSPRWVEIRELLKDKKKNKKAIKDWAVKLEEGSKETHCVPAWVIEKMMWRWEPTMTVELVLGAKISV